jgi:hypothetical protein
LHALFIWYLRSRSNLIDQFVRRYQPKGARSQLRTHYGTGLTGCHLLQANPSYADPETCGGKFAPVVDVLSSVCEPNDVAARLICLLSAVSSDARTAVEALVSVSVFKNKSFKRARAEAGHEDIYSRILFAPLYMEGVHAVQFGVQVLYDAVRARVKVILKELESGVRQHFYARQLWEDVTGWLPMLLQQMLRKRFGHLVMVTCESGLSGGAVEEDIDFQVTTICSLPDRRVYCDPTGARHDPLVIPGSFAVVGVRQGGAIPPVSYGNTVGSRADLCNGIEGAVVLIAPVQIVPTICHEHFLHQMRCVREMEALRDAGHFNTAGQEWLLYYSTQYPHAAGPTRNLMFNVVQGWEAAADDLVAPP